MEVVGEIYVEEANVEDQYDSVRQQQQESLESKMVP